jgi:hypothetical protein
MMDRTIATGLRAVALGAAMLVGIQTASAQMVEGAVPVEPQPAEDQLEPGLSVAYVEENFRDLSEMMGGDGTPGEPLANLDATPGRGEPVLTSGKSMGVGAFIRGLIRLDEEGTWTFRVHSNDGVQVTIGGQLVHVDPGVHSDTMSPPVLFEVEEPGWYAIEVDYFQRKGTATLQLLWTRPSGGAEEVVPPEAFAHLAE